MSKEKSADVDPPMTEEEAKIVGQLSDLDLDVIDELLLANVSDTWLKSAFVIGGVMLKVPDEYEEVPDVFYSSRLAVLEKEGMIKVKGDLGKMKLCEIALADKAG